MEIVFSSVSLEHPVTKEVILKDVSFEVKEGKMIGISGKHLSKVMNMISLLLPVKGTILIDGNAFLTRDPMISKKIGDMTSALVFTNDTVAKELEQTYLMYYPKDHMEKRIKEVCKMSLLPISILERHPNTLSTTEKKKVALAKILLQNPDILVLEDFPYGLSYQDQEYYKKLFRKLCGNYHKSVVISTNQIDFFFNSIDELFVFSNKKIVYQGDKNIFYEEGLYQYIDCPEIISCIFYLRSKGHRTPNYYEVKELLKAIYRDVA